MIPSEIQATANAHRTKPLPLPVIKRLLANCRITAVCDEALVSYKVLKELITMDEVNYDELSTVQKAGMLSVSQYFIDRLFWLDDSGEIKFVADD